MELSKFSAESFSTFDAFDDGCFTDLEKLAMGVMSLNVAFVLVTAVVKKATDTLSESPKNFEETKSRRKVTNSVKFFGTVVVSIGPAWVAPFDKSFMLSFSLA